MASRKSENALAAVTCATETSSVVRSVTCCAKVCGKGAVEGTQSATFRFANWARVQPRQSLLGTHCRADADWRPTLRTNGVANGHYRSGGVRDRKSPRLNSS